MLASPWIKAMVGEPPETLVRDLAPDSTTMMTLREDFAEASTKLKIVSCYELRETPTSVKQEDGTLKRCGIPQMMVRKESACLSWEHEEKIPINENHSMIAKLARREGSAYYKVKDAVAKLVGNARISVPNQFRRLDIRDHIHDISSTSNAVRQAFQSMEHRDSEICKSLDDGLMRMCGMCTVLVQEQIGDFFLGPSVPIETVDLIRSTLREFARILQVAKTVNIWPTWKVGRFNQSTVPSLTLGRTAFGDDSSELDSGSPIPKNIYELGDRIFCLTEDLQQILSLQMLKTPHASALNFRTSESTTQHSGLAYVARQQNLFRSMDRLQPAIPLPGNLEVPSKEPADGCITVGRYQSNTGKPEDQYVIVEYRQYSALQTSGHPMSGSKMKIAESVKLQAQNLAALLSQPDLGSGIDDSFHILQCLGIIDDQSSGRLAFLYRIPEQLIRPDGTLSKRVITLKQAIRELSKRPLEIRFGLAYRVAASLLNIHSHGWVHKNICSANIICVLPQERGIESKSKHWDVYLKGFESSRPVSAYSSLTPKWNENTWYRHPDRFGHSVERFIKEYDIYSLGLVLLEIGMGELLQDRYGKATSKLKAGHVLTPCAWREILLRLAKTKLPVNMGGSYAKAVERCIEGNFHIDYDDVEETKLGLAFQQLVVHPIAGGVAV
ncbi:hypothetical protein F4806DRAFT_503127 [Annulohypoxylon nitens]|nr:hypothetical protein F4806DRAFT_503127 [Annulohypoxylon nitens]